MRSLVITASITRRDEQSLGKYLNEISKYNVLTPNEEFALFEAYQAGDQMAYSKIILHNLRFVISVAKQYQSPGLWLGDIINEGNIGLIKAAQRFDTSRGFKFISYAVWWIRQSILQSINEKGRNIRIPLNIASQMSKVNRAAIDILQKEERTPTDMELAEMTGLTVKMVQKCLTYYKRSKSLDAPLGDDSNASLASLTEDKGIQRPDFQTANIESQQIEIEHLLNRLPERQSIVITMYYGIGQRFPSTLSDISEHLGLTRERVRQIKDKGLRKLRHISAKQPVSFSYN
jgi:RNA polymerase primary sigma factor